MTDHADTIRRALNLPAEGHHRLCATRAIPPHRGECDCHGRRWQPALDALDALVAQRREARDEIERLRAALREIEKARGGSVAKEDLRAMARAALGEQKP